MFIYVYIYLSKHSIHRCDNNVGQIGRLIFICRNLRGESLGGKVWFEAKP